MEFHGNFEEISSVYNEIFLLKQCGQLAEFTRKIFSPNSVDSWQSVQGKFCPQTVLIIGRVYKENFVLKQCE